MLHLHVLYRFIIINATKDRVIPKIHFGVSRSLKNIADINDESISAVPCDKGYNCADGRYHFTAPASNDIPKNKYPITILLIIYK